jgi:hypothetical protein
MTRRSTGAPLEQACQRPGLWHIEGHQAIRVSNATGPGSWWMVYRPDPNTDGGRVLVTKQATLERVREYIRQEMDR